MSRAKIGVLLVEDNPADAQMIEELLAEANQADLASPLYDVVRAASLSQATEILTRGDIHLIFLDTSLPDCSNLDAVARITALQPSLPVVVMLDVYDETLLLSSIKAGAQDYLEKNTLNAASLSRLARIAIERKNAEVALQERPAALQNAYLFDEINRQGIENARLFEETQRRAEQLGVVYEIGQEIARLTDVLAIMNMSVQCIVEKLGYYGAIIALMKNEQLVFEAGSTGRGKPLQRGAILSLEQGVMGLVARTGKAYLAKDVSTDPHYLFYDQLPETRSELAVPIHGSVHFLGVLDVQSRYLGALDDTDRQVLEAVAGQCATALENAHLFAETRRRLAELEAIHKISISLRSAQTLDEMMPVLLDRTLEVLDASAGMISLYDPSTSELRPMVQKGWFEDAVVTTAPVGNDIARHAIEPGEIFLTSDHARDPLAPMISLVNIPPGWTGLCQPICSTHETIGEVFISAPSPRIFTENDVHLLTILAEIAGNAIHRTRLHEQLEHRAEELHARNLELARLYRASGPLISSVTLDTQAMAQGDCWIRSGKSSASRIAVW